MVDADVGRALRARSRASRVEALGRALERLADPGGETYARLCEEIPAATGFHPATVRAGLDLALAQFHRRGLEALVASELGPDEVWNPANAPRTTAVVTGGAIPMPTFEALLAPLVVGSTVRVRPGSRERIGAGIFARAVAAEDAELGAAIECVAFARDDANAARAFFDADAVIASGSDATIARIRGQVPPTARFVAYGHRLSIAVVDGRAEAGLAAAVAEDVVLWDQLGCLSPVALLALDDVDGWAEAVALALERRSRALPRGAVPLAAAAAIRHERDTAELRAAADGRTRVFASADATVVREADARWGPTPLHRFLRVHPVDGLDGLAAALAPVRAWLSTVGAPEPLHPALSGFGFRRVRPGQMQAPPLDWNHDGIGTLRPLLPHRGG